jgi:hypothetical protein
MQRWKYLRAQLAPPEVEKVPCQKHRFVFKLNNSCPSPATMKQQIQSSDEKVWSDVESNKKVVSDDDALLSSTGKVGELKRYVSLYLELWSFHLTISGYTISGLVSLHPTR